MDLLQVVVELGQKARGGVLLEAQQLTGSEEEQSHQLAVPQRSPRHQSVCHQVGINPPGK